MKKKYLIDTSEKIVSNGETYFLRIRSNKPDGPVVLFLHGGAGSADRPFVIKHQSPLADFCTIVAWDQRGAGMAYNPKVAKTEVLTKELYISDAYNVITYLKERFHKEKIYIVGHSFGSQLGVWVALKHPEVIEAFAGIGQVVDEKAELMSFDFTMREAEKRNDKKAIKALSEIGPPVNGQYKDNKVLVQRNYLSRYGGVTYGEYKGQVARILKFLPMMFKEYSLKTMLYYLKGNNYCLNSPLVKTPIHFMEEASELFVPVYLMLGHHDYNCPFARAKEWFNQLKAPYKRLIWFEKSGHSPHWEESDLWNETFKNEVLKLGV